MKSRRAGRALSRSTQRKRPLAGPSLQQRISVESTRVLEHRAQGEHEHGRRGVLALDLELVDIVGDLIVDDFCRGVAVEVRLGLDAVGVEQVVADEAQHEVAR